VKPCVRRSTRWQPLPRLATLLGAEWFDRYGRAVDEYHYLKGIAARQEYAETIGSDGMQLLIAVYAETAPQWLGASHRNPAADLGTSLCGEWSGALLLLIAPAGSRFDSP